MFLACAGAVPSNSRAAQQAAAYLAETSVAHRRLKVDFSLENVCAALGAGTCVLTLALEQGHEGVTLAQKYKY